MTWDILFADGMTVRVKHDVFHCACIIAQAQRVMRGDIGERWITVLRGTAVEALHRGQKVEATHRSLIAGADKITIRIPDESLTLTLDRSEHTELCNVLSRAIKSPGSMTIVIKKGDELCSG